MVIPPLIEHKRDGHALAPEQWARLIEEYTADRVPDYQMAAFLMAIVWRGLAPEELAALTEAMLDSGDRLRFDGLPPRGWTSTPPAAWATRSPSCSRRWSRLRRGRADDVGPGARPHRRHARQARVHSRLPDRISRSTRRSEQIEPLGCAHARPDAPRSPRPTARCTRCATPRARWSRFRSSRPASCRRSSRKGSTGWCST